MEQKKPFFKRLITSYRALPDKKRFLEFVTALLSVPVLITVIVLNLSNLRQGDAKEPETPEKETVVVTIPVEKNDSTTVLGSANPTSTPEPTTEICKKEIGPVAIVSPKEGQSVSDNPLEISIDAGGDEYCTVVWSYRINGGRWSEYDDKSIALFNPPTGEIKLEVRFKSLVTKEEKILNRTFTFEAEEVSSPTPTS